MGESFGEKKLQTADYEDPRKVYVNLKEKTPKELVNLAIVKIKLEFPKLLSINKNANKHPGNINNCLIQ